MIDWRLRRQLDRTSGRLWHLQTLRHATIVWLVFAVLGALLWWGNRTTGYSIPDAISP
jgi:hypothetical protein